MMRQIISKHQRPRYAIITVTNSAEPIVLIDQATGGWQTKQRLTLLPVSAWTTGGWQTKQRLTLLPVLVNSSSISRDIKPTDSESTVANASELESLTESDASARMVVVHWT